MNGLTFNGKHSSEFGLVMFSKNRPILPEPKIVSEDLPGMDGEYNYSAVNPDGEVKYKPRTLEIDFALKEPDPKRLRLLSNRIAAWLACGEQQLIFDDEPEKYYMAQVSNKLDLDNQIVTVKRFTLQFKCRPFKFGLYAEGADVWNTFNFEEDVSQTTEFDVTDSSTATIINVGRSATPVINVSASMTVTVGESTYNLVTGDNKLFDIRLKTGENQVTVTGTGHIKFIYRKEIL